MGLSSTLAIDTIEFGSFQLTGGNTLINLVAAGTNALNGAIRGWEEPLASIPSGIVRHDDGRPLLGRKLHHKSHRELRDLGLVIDDEPEAAA